MASQSVEPHRCGVEAQSFGVPGHSNIPGNELAVLMSHQAQHRVKGKLVSPSQLQGGSLTRT